jgi:DNA polymerase-3 subunit beta
MNITCVQEKFKRALFYVERAVAKNPTLPILEYLLVEGTKSGVKLSATNLEIGVVAEVSAKIDTEGKVALPVRLLMNFVQNIPSSETITLVLEEDGVHVECRSGSSVARIKSVDTQDFPIIPQTTDDVILDIDTSVFRSVLPRVLTCVSTNQTRPELTGVNILLEEECLSFAATDVFRLFEQQIPFPKNEQNKQYREFSQNTSSIIVPQHAMAEVQRITGDMSGKIRITISENQIFFSLDTVRLVSRLIDGKYPEYRQIIPREFQTAVLVEKEELVRAVKLASVFSQKNQQEVLLDVQPQSQQLIVSAQSQESGSNKTSVSISASGEAVSVVLNPRFLLDGVATVKSETVALSLNDASAPVVIRSYNKKEDLADESSTYIVMPIKN